MIEIKVYMTKDGNRCNPRYESEITFIGKLDLEDSERDILVYSNIQTRVEEILEEINKKLADLYHFEDKEHLVRYKISMAGFKPMPIIHPINEERLDDNLFLTKSEAELACRSFRSVTKLIKSTFRNYRAISDEKKAEIWEEVLLNMQEFIFDKLRYEGGKQETNE